MTQEIFTIPAEHYVLKAVETIPPLVNGQPGSGRCSLYIKNGHEWHEAAPPQLVLAYNFTAAPIMNDGQFLFGTSASHSVSDSDRCAILNTN